MIKGGGITYGTTSNTGTIVQGLDIGIQGTAGWTFVGDPIETNQNTSAIPSTATVSQIENGLIINDGSGQQFIFQGNDTGGLEFVLIGSEGLSQTLQIAENGEVETTTHDPLNLNLWDTTTTVIDSDGNIADEVVSYDNLAGNFNQAHDLTLFDVSEFDADSAAYFTGALRTGIPEGMSVVETFDADGRPVYDLASNSFSIERGDSVFTSYSAAYWQELNIETWAVYGSDLLYSLEQLDALQDTLVWNAEQLAFAQYDDSGYDYNGLDVDGHDSNFSAGSNNNSTGIG